MNTTITHLMALQAAGTSEGVRKEWETRKSGGKYQKLKTWMRDKAARIARGENQDDPSSSEGTPRGLGWSAEADIKAREFSTKKRKKLAKSGAAMPGGGFPIVNKHDLKNAERAIGRAKNPTAARAHIRERAKALGAPVSDSFKAYGTSEGVKKEWETRGRGKNLSVPDQHQIRIAKQTLKMNDTMAKVMGGMTKDEARAILKKHGVKSPETFNPGGRSFSQRPAESYRDLSSGSRK